MPTHTSCNLGCKFCHLTPLKNPAKNLSHQEISEGIDYIIKDLKLRGCTVLLISYMGSGDPLMNVEGVIESAKTTIIEHSSRFCGVRFAISTMMPYIEILENSRYSMIGFTEAVKTNDLPFKVHFPYIHLLTTSAKSLCLVRHLSKSVYDNCAGTNT